MQSKKGRAMTNWLQIVVWCGVVPALVLNAGGFIYHLMQIARTQRLNAMLLHLCVQTVIMRPWATHNRLGVSINARPMTLQEWQETQQ